MKFFIAAAALMLMFAAVPGALAQGLQPQLTVVMTRYDPSPAEPGQYLTIWIKVQNQGPVAARNVTLELLDTYPFSIDPSENRLRQYAEVMPTEVLLAEYRVRVDEDALDGRNPIDLRVSSDGRAFFTKGFDIYVESKLVEFAIGSLLSEPERLVAGSENNKITVSIQNVGETSATLARAQLILPDGFSESQSYSDEYSVGNIAAESAASAIFYIDIDEGVQPGDHMATMYVYHKEGGDGEYRRKTLTVRIPVRPSPAFEITSVNVTPESIGQGMKVEMKLTVANKGSQEAENVNVRVLKEATQPFDFDEKSNFIGTLGPGESGEAVFHFDVDAAADVKEYILQIEVRYTTNGDVYLDDDRITVRVSERLPSYTGLYVVGIIMLVIIAVVIWYWRR